jgi:hypothetical protein
LAAAQSDLKTLQQSAVQSTVSTSATSAQGRATAQTGATIQQDFAKLATDLQTGNLKAAQTDYTSIVQAFQSQAAQSQAPAGGHHHHHHGGGSSTDESTASSTDNSTSSSASANPVAQLFTELGQAQQTGNLPSTQQAYSALQKDFQQFAPASSSSGSTSAVTGSAGISINA